jgi:hypothetical protein
MCVIEYVCVYVLYTYTHTLRCTDGKTMHHNTHCETHIDTRTLPKIAETADIIGAKIYHNLTVIGSTN